MQSFVDLSGGIELCFLIHNHAVGRKLPRLNHYVVKDKEGKRKQNKHENKIFYFFHDKTFLF